jgi:ABC-2 type transport system permease protein
MRKFYGMIKVALKDAMAYKFDMMLTIVFAPISILISYFLWKAIFAYTGTEMIGGFTFPEMITYFVITWIVGIITYTDIGDFISYDVKEGNIAKNLLYPTNYIWFCLVYSLGGRILAIFIEALPIIIISFIIFHIKINLVALPLFIISTFLALILNFIMTTLFALSAFWIVQNRGILKLKRVFVHFLSGAVLPITFFPLVYQKISFYLPFQYLDFVPINFWLGKYEFSQGMIMLGMQALWIGIFILLCFLVWKKAITKATAVGI